MINKVITDVTENNSRVAVGGDMVKRVVRVGDDVMREDVVENSGESVPAAAMRVVMKVVAIGTNTMVFVIMNGMATDTSVVSIVEADVVMGGAKVAVAANRRVASIKRTVVTIARSVVIKGKKGDIPTSTVSTITTYGK
jgi:hypothetical protein